MVFLTKQRDFDSNVDNYKLLVSRPSQAKNTMQAGGYYLLLL